MDETVTDSELHAAWRRLRMAGDFKTSMQHRAVRRAVESAARAMRLRAHRHLQGYVDNKRLAANDPDD